MKETNNKQNDCSTIIEKRSPITYYFKSSDTVIQTTKKKSSQEISQIQNSRKVYSWKDGHWSPIYTDPGQDTFEDHPVNHPRKILSLFLLFKLLYAGTFYSIMTYKSGVSGAYKIAGGLFGFMIIAAYICLEDCIQKIKLKIAKPFYGAKTFIIMGVYAVFVLFCCFLRYDNQMSNMELLFILILMSVTNEFLQLTDCFYLDQKNYTKLSGFKYTWMILLPIFLTLQIYGNLSFKFVICFTLINCIATAGVEETSMLYLGSLY